MITPTVLDIYHGDDVENFAQVVGAGILGVIHKASQGTADVDPMYAKRRAEFASAGLKLWGAYHFLTAASPVQQADLFVHVAAPDDATLMACDHETQDVPLANAIAFMVEVERLTGRECVLYSGSLVKEQIADATPDQLAYLGARRLWLPEYGTEAKCPECWAGGEWLWQYTGDGAGPEPHGIAGMRGHVDLNTYLGTEAELTAEWAGNPVTPS